MRQPTKIDLTRRYLAWAKPGGDELGRVELLASDELGAPDPFEGRTAQTVEIPAGCVLRLVVEDPPPELCS